MPQLIELDVSRSTSIDAANTANAVRVFDTELQDEQAAKTAFFEEQGTGAYPTDSRLRYDRLQIERNARGSGLRVTAFYSTNGAGRFSKQRKPETYSYKWKYGNVREEVEIPVNIREVRTQKGQSGEVTYEVWVVSKVKVFEYRTAWTFSAYANVENIRAFETITTQMNRVHTINGVRALFSSASVALDEARREEGADPAATDNWYKIDYTWTVDRGTIYPPGFPEEDDRYRVMQVQNLPTSPRPIDGLIRQPYTVLTVLPSLSPRSEPSATIQVSPYTEDPDGWLALPGTEGIR
jgi:hypothetical protein